MDAAPRSCSSSRNNSQSDLARAPGPAAPAHAPASPRLERTLLRRSLLALGLCAALAACGEGADTLPGDAASADLARLPQAPRSTVVLVHGMGGFQKLLGVDYFFQVPGDWTKAGARVFVPATTALASVEERANELKAQLDKISGPLVLVAHSQGGLDARYLISKLGYAGRVKALVTIATPHHGTQVADILLAAAGNDAIAAADALIGVLGWSLDGAREMTVANMEGVFNPQVPDANGVTYWSYSGEASPLGLGGQGWLHVEFAATAPLLDALGIANDGIVPEASAHWGQFQGKLKADHLGEVGHPLGFTPGFDHQGFYRALLQRIHDQGW
jgi:triacylglycerol lipase